MKDFDSADRTQNFRIAGLSAFGGVVVGVAGARMAGPLGFLVGWLLGTLLIYFTANFVSDRAGRAAASLYLASGSTTPAARDYSLAETLAVRGHLQEAAEEYERCAVVFDTDPQPRLQLARLFRDRLKKPEEAAVWFKQVLAMPNLEPAAENLVARELLELYSIRLQQPARALPVLAQLSERRKDSPLGAWAREQLERIRTLPRREGARD
jgi:hypothetical protein